MSTESSKPPPTLCNRQIKDITSKNASNLSVVGEKNQMFWLFRLYRATFFWATDICLVLFPSLLCVFLKFCIICMSVCERERGRLLPWDGGDQSPFCSHRSCHHCWTTFLLAAVGGHCGGYEVVEINLRAIKTSDFLLKLSPFQGKVVDLVTSIWWPLTIRTLENQPDVGCEAPPSPPSLSSPKHQQ